jgi:hypothetical protein
MTTKNPTPSAQSPNVVVITHSLPADDDAFVRPRQLFNSRRERRDGSLEIEVGVVNVSKSEWHRGVREGRYPQGIEHGNVVVYRAGTIRALLRRIATGHP